MLNFDAKTNTLYAKKFLNLPFIPENIIQTKRDEYEHYLNTTLSQDLEYLVRHLELKLKESVSIYDKKVVRSKDGGATIIVQFKVGDYISEGIQLLSLPRMDNAALYTNKAITSDLVKMKGLYTKKDEVQLSADSLDIVFNVKKTKATVSLGRSKRGIPLGALFVVLYHELYAQLPFTSVKSSWFTEYLNKLKSENLFTYQAIVGKDLTNFEVATTGTCRNSMDEILNFSRVVGEVLAEDASVYKKGTVITKTIADELYEKGVTHIQIKAVPNILGKKINKELITQAMLDRFALLGEPVKIDGFENPFEFAHDIFSNGSKGNGSLTKQDLLALVSYSMDCRRNTDLQVVTKIEADFRKQVYTVHDTFSNAFRRITREAFSNNNIAIEHLKGTSKVRDKTKRDQAFYRFTSLFNSFLTSRTATLRPVNKTNPASLYSAISQIAPMHAKEVTADRRATYASQLGRIDPYQTPSGSKIGVNITPTLGVINSGGFMYVPYYKVIKKGSTYTLDKTTHHFHQLEDAPFTIGDLMTLEFKNNADIFNSPIISEYVIAKVPVYDSSEVSSTIDRVHVSELDYVYISPEAASSMVTSLIPLVGMNDGARVTFAVSMLQQAVPLQFSQRPRVYTASYKHLIDFTPNYVVRAKDDGVVNRIFQSSIFCLENGNTVVYKIVDESLTSNCVNPSTIKVKVGQEYTKDAVLADSLMSRDGFFTPGRNVLVAYMALDGLNHEDAFPISTSCAFGFTSVIVHTIAKEKRKLYSGYYRRHMERKKYFKPNTPLMRISENGGASSFPTIVSTPVNKSGIYVSSSIKDGSVFSVSLLDTSPISQGDKIAGRHGNKSTSSVVLPDFGMPMFANGVHIEGAQNPAGIPSRMNQGQQLEAHLGFIAELLDIYIETDSFNSISLEESSILYELLYDIVNCNGNLNVVDSYVSKGVPISLIMRAKDKYEKIKYWAGCFDNKGNAVLYNPKTGKPYTNAITFGVAYYSKLEHIASNKAHGRSGLSNGQYTQIFSQPTKGSSQGGGQRAGEMEIDAAAAHGASAVVAAMHSYKSDNVAQRNALYEVGPSKSIDQALVDVPRSGTSTRSFEVLSYLLEVTGVSLEDDEGADLSFEGVQTRTSKKSVRTKTTIEEEVDVDLLARASNILKELGI